MMTEPNKHRLMKEANKDLGRNLNLVEWQVLAAIDGAGCETKWEIMAHTGLTLGQVTQAVGVLVKPGIVNEG